MVKLVFRGGLVMKLSTLHLFVQVMEQGSFSKAAITAFTTQSNISKQMGCLETEIGVRLFDRSNQGIQPTPAAICLFSGLKEQLPALQKLIDQAQRAAPSQDLSLKVAISDSMSINHIAPLLSLFRRESPSVELKLISLSQESILRYLADGYADVALIYSVWPTDAACITRKAITRSNPCIYYSKREWPDPVSVESFRSATFVKLEKSSVDSVADLPFAPEQVISVDSLRTLQFYVASGMACAILGRSQLLLDSADISICPLDCARNQVGTDIVWTCSNKNPAIYLFEKAVDRFVRDISTYP